MPTYTAQYPPAHSNAYVKATTWWGSPYAGDAPHYYPWYATNPALSVVGDHEYNAWVSQEGTLANQRFHIDLGSAKVIKRIYYENSHYYGGYTNRGVQNFTLWGSNSASAFAALTYGTDTGWTQLTTSQSTFDQHVASNQADPKYITVTNTTAYRYYALKFADNWGGSYYMSVRRLVLQTQNEPDAPTSVSATDGTDTDKVTITWTKSTGATGYKVYEGSNLLATLGDVATYDDTAAPAPTITEGAASASNGTSADHVVLGISGHAANNGASRSYSVKAFNAVGDSAASTADTGYRKAGSLTYQWQRSSGDSDADYADISGATTADYNDTGAPADGSGRYFRCVLSAEGAASANSAADRGYRYAVPSPPTVTTTSPATDIDTTSVKCSGVITATGGENCSARGICYNTTGTPTIADHKVYDAAGGYIAGSFTQEITGLTAETTYYFRAYAVNSSGVGYGAAVTFKTKANALAVTTGDPATDITDTTATVTATIASTGGVNATTVGVCWNTTGTPTTADSTVSESGAFNVGAYPFSLTGLTASTTYYVRAYAINAVGTSYGSAVAVATTATPDDGETEWQQEANQTNPWLSETGASASWLIEQDGHTGRMIFVDCEALDVDCEDHYADGADVYHAEDY